MGDQGNGSGVQWRRRLQLQSLCSVEKRLLHFSFKFLLCLALLVLLYNVSQSGWTLAYFPYYQNFYRWSTGNLSHDNEKPPLHIYTKFRFKLSANDTTTQPPTTLPTVATTGAIQYHSAHPHNYHFVMDESEVCKTKSPFLVLMVPVAPQNTQARNAIRQTWGNESFVQDKVVLTLFMLGVTARADDGLQEKLKQESDQHHDLIQSNFMDTYLNLTTKTMVIMDWLATRCPSAPFAMKVDSDMFLNTDNLVKMLVMPTIPKENYLTGMLMWNREVIRWKGSKWYVPVELYPEPRYPTYTLGMGYVFSNDLPQKFVEVSKFIKPFNIEDAYIGMCMKLLGLAPTSPPNPWQFKAYNTKYDRCEYSKIITYILGSSQELINYWTDLKKPGPPC